jgi:hypothetical protein
LRRVSAMVRDSASSAWWWWWVTPTT